MEQPIQFRSAFNGFNREDVVHYMEFVNTKHSAQIAQLSSELEYLRGKQSTLDDSRIAELEKQLAAEEAENASLKVRIAELEQQLQEAGKAPAAPAGNSELEAYRRAERVERMAKERAHQIGVQAEAALGQVNMKLDAAASQIDLIADRVTGQLNDLRKAMSAGRQELKEAAAELGKLQEEE